MEQKEIARVMLVLVEKAALRLQAATVRLAAFLASEERNRAEAEIELGEIGCGVILANESLNKVETCVLGFFQEGHKPEEQVLLLKEKRKLVYGKEPDKTEIDSKGIAVKLIAEKRIEDLYKVISITETSLKVLPDSAILIASFKKVTGKKKASIAFEDMTAEEKKKNNI